MREGVIMLLLSISLRGIAADEAAVNEGPVIHDCLTIPTSLSLDEDCSTCDRFNVTSSCPLDYFSMEIFDRWGNKVFGTFDIHKYWYGSRGESYLPVGNYIYVILYRQSPDSALLLYKGTVVFLH